MLVKEGSKRCFTQYATNDQKGWEAALRRLLKDKHGARCLGSATKRKARRDQRKVALSSLSSSRSCPLPSSLPAEPMPLAAEQCCRDGEADLANVNECRGQIGIAPFPTSAELAMEQAPGSPKRRKTTVASAAASHLPSDPFSESTHELSDGPAIGPLTPFRHTASDDMGMRIGMDDVNVDLSGDGFPFGGLSHMGADAAEYGLCDWAEPSVLSSCMPRLLA